MTSLDVRCEDVGPDLGWFQKKENICTRDATPCQVHPWLKGYSDIFLEGTAQAVVYFNK